MPAPRPAADCVWSTQHDAPIVPDWIGMSVNNLADSMDPTKPRCVTSLLVCVCARARVRARPASAART